MPLLDTILAFIDKHPDVTNSAALSILQTGLINLYSPKALANALKPVVSNYSNIIITVFSTHPAIVKKDIHSELSLLKILKAVFLDLSCMCRTNEYQLCKLWKYLIKLIDRILLDNQTAKKLIEYIIDAVNELIRILPDGNQCYVDEEGSNFTDVAEQAAGFKRKGKHPAGGKKITIRKNKRTMKNATSRR
jgi:hypothetical protein